MTTRPILVGSERQVLAIHDGYAVFPLESEALRKFNRDSRVAQVFVSAVICGIVLSCWIMGLDLFSCLLVTTLGFFGAFAAVDGISLEEPKTSDAELFIRDSRLEKLVDKLAGSAPKGSYPLSLIVKHDVHPDQAVAAAQRVASVLVQKPRLIPVPTPVSTQIPESVQALFPAGFTPNGPGPQDAPGGSR